MVHIGDKFIKGYPDDIMSLHKAIIEDIYDIDPTHEYYLVSEYVFISGSKNIQPNINLITLN